MKTRLLDPIEFKATFAEPMRDVSASASNIDIWPYVEAIPANELCSHMVVDGGIEQAYRNGSDTFDHVLVVTKSKNVFLVVVIDLVAGKVFGHHLLDLNHEYGL